jgi:hypothetical protein
VFRTAVREDPARAIPILKKEWFTTRSVDGKNIILSALGATRDPELIKSSLLPFLFQSSPPAPASDSVPSADMSTLAASFAANRHARPLQWEYLKEHFDDATKKLGHGIVVDRFIERSLGDFSAEEDAKDIERFFEGRDTRAFERTLKNVLDMTGARVAYKERDGERLKEWLVERGYADKA